MLAALMAAGIGPSAAFATAYQLNIMQAPGMVGGAGQPSVTVGLVATNGAWGWTDGSTSASCLTYRTQAMGQGVPGTDGVYRLTAGGQTIETFCDMTNGGWTLVARRLRSSLGTPVTQFASATPSTVGYLPDASWQALVAGSTRLRMTDEDTAPPNNANEISLAPLQVATVCHPLSDSLSRNTLAWVEDSGCTGAGGDYLVIGDNAPYMTYISQGSHTARWEVADRWDVTTIGPGAIYPTSATYWLK